MEDVNLHMKCIDCGNEQVTTALNPEFDEDGSLASWLGSSTYFYCNVCDNTNLMILSARRGVHPVAIAI